MVNKRNIPLPSHFLSKVFAWIVISLAIVVLFSLAFGINSFIRFNGTWTPMKANTAICFAFLGWALLLLIKSKRNFIYKLLVFLVLITSGIVIIEYLGHWDAGIDELVFKDEKTVTQYPGRMAPNTAIMFFLSSLSLLIFSQDNKKRLQVAEVLIIPVILIAFVAMIGYVYNTDKLYKVAGHTSLAFHTGLGFLFFAIGFLAFTSRNYQSFFSDFNKDTNAARIGIHKVFVLVVVIVFVGWLRLRLQDAGYIDTESGTSIMIISFTITFFFVTLAGTKRLNHLELERKKAEHLIIESEKKFRGLLDAAPDAILIVNKEGNIAIVNLQAESLFGYNRKELIGLGIEKLIPQDLHNKHVKNRENFFKNPKTRTMGGGFSLLALRKNGEKFPVEISLAPLETSEGLVVSAAIRDITERIKTMSALQESEERYFNMVDAVEDYSILLLDKNGNVQNWNRGAEKIKGYSEEEIIGKNFEVFFTSEDQRLGLPQSLLETARMEGKAVNEGLAMRKDRTLYWTALTINALYNDKDEVIGFSKVARDITEKKIFTDALEQSEQQIKAIFNGAPDAVVVIDEEGRVIQWNPKATELFGWTQDEIIGEHLSDTIVPPQFREAHIKGMKRFMTTEQSRIIGQNIEIKAVNKDHKELDVSLNISPIKLNNGYLFVGFIRDITQQKRASETTLNNERRFKQALGILGDNVWEHDFKTEKTYFANTVHDLLGFPNNDLSSNVNLWWSRTHPDDRWMLEENDKKYRAGLKYHHSLEYRMFHKDGTLLWILDRGTVIDKYENGMPLRIVGTHTDITKRRENKQLLEQLNNNLEKRTTELTASNKELEQFAYVASHDLQEPLRMISSFLQLLQKKYKGQMDETADKYIHLAVDGAGRMKLLINDLLLLSRVSTSKLNFNDVDVNQSVKNVVASLQQSIEESRAVINIGKLPLIKANPSQIEQLFQNLIGNAIKYRRQDITIIDVNCIEEEMVWGFSVRDNGIGFDKKYEEKIFTIFQRLHTKNEYPGTGIGLAICKKIVERHGGKFRVDSEPGKGSTFYFTISKNIK